METTTQYNPFDPQAIKDPYPIWDELRSSAPVYRSPMASDSWMVSDEEDADAVFLVTRHKEATYIMEHPEIFTSGSKTGPEVPPEVLEELAEGLPLVTTLYNTDPPDHTRLRTLVQSGLSTQQVSANAAKTRQTAHAFIDEFGSAAAAELLEQFIKPLANTALLDFIGIPREDQAQVTPWNKLWEEVFIPGNPPEDQRQAARQVVAYQRYYQKAVDERRENPRGDLLTSMALASTNQGDRLSMAEIAWCLMELIGAGVANTADGLANILLVLLQEPDRWQAVLDDRGLLPAAIDEGLRFEGPVQWLPRETAKEVELDGVRIPKGATVMILHAAANRDPEAFPDPARFDVRRAGNGRHVAYGRGIHYCVGAGWSRMAIRVGIEALMDRLPRLRLREGYDPEFYLPVPVLRCVAKLPVTWGE
jgi:cytochrome P450